MYLHILVLVVVAIVAIARVVNEATESYYLLDPRHKKNLNTKIIKYTMMTNT